MATIAEALTLGLKHHQAGQLQQAESIYRQILKVDPQNADAWHYLGVLAMQVGQFPAAVDSIRRAIAIHPSAPGFHSNLGSVLGAMGRYDEAVESFKAALKLDANHFDAHNNLGTALIKQGKFEEAVASLRRAVKLRPQSADAHINLGNALQDMEKLEEAVASYRQALRIDSNHADGRYNLGLAQGKLGQFDQALTNYQHALRVRPNHADAHNNLGNVLRELGRFAEALESYENAIRIKPELAQARKNRGMAWLRLGDYQRGWPEYEWRWKCDDSPPRGFKEPLWDGSPLEGRTILLHAEQGLGDTLQFVRFAPLVHERGGRVLLECQTPLVELLKNCRGVEQLIPRGEPLPAFDVHAPLMSLPTIFGTTLETLPAEVPYVFVDQQLAEHWREELEKLSGVKIGINWQGNPKFRADRFRSMPLAHFGRLANVEGVRLISLQRGPGVEQLAALNGRFEVTQLETAADDAQSFADTAAIMQNLDLVVTSCTSIAHLAGALGIPCWVAIPFSADWRWMLDRDDSPWYPSLRLFRPASIAGWEELFERMADELGKLVQQQGLSRAV